MGELTVRSNGGYIRGGGGGGGGEEGRRRKSGGEEQEEDEGERNLQYFTVYHKFEQRRDSANILF